MFPDRAPVKSSSSPFSPDVSNTLLQQRTSKPKRNLWKVWWWWMLAMVVLATVGSCIPEQSAWGWAGSLLMVIGLLGALTAAAQRLQNLPPL